VLAPDTVHDRARYPIPGHQSLIPILDSVRGAPTNHYDIKRLRDRVARSFQLRAAMD